LLNIKRIARQLVGTDGAEIAEAALVLPLVAMLLFGIIWFGRAFNIYSTIQQAAQQGALTAARATCATCGDTFPVDGPPGTNGTVTAAVEAVLKASNLDPAQIVVSPSPPATQFCSNVPSACSVTDKITTCRNAWLNSAFPAQPPQCGTAVSFQYPFQFNFPGTPLNMQTIKLSAQAQSRMEN